MSMKFICFVALTILFVAMIFCRKELNPDNPDSLFAKKEWANLQSVDVQGRSFLELEHAKVVRFNGSDILLGNKGKCKILLNSNFPPYFKMFGNFSDAM